MSSSTSATQSSQSAPTQSSQSASREASLQSTGQKIDPAWEHCKLTTKEGGKKVYTCVYCGKNFKGGGINRVKQHLAGKVGDVLGCDKVTADVRYRMEENLKEIKKKEEESRRYMG